MAGCNVVVTVDAEGGAGRQADVVAAVNAIVTDFALLTVDALCNAATPDAGWAVVDPPALEPPPQPVPRLTTTPTAAWLRIVEHSGGPPPGPPPELAAAEAAFPPPPPPPRAAASASASSPSPSGPAPSPEQHDWESRLAASLAHGTAVAMALTRRSPVPAALEWPPPLRNRIWVAVGGAPEAVGIYAKWNDCSALLRADPPCTVRAFPSLAEAKAFARGFVGRDAPDLVDRRYC